MEIVSVNKTQLYDVDVVIDLDVGCNLCKCTSRVKVDWLE